MKIYNRTGYVLEDLQQLQKIGTVRSNWRKRLIDLYETPDEKVLSVGTALDRSMIVMAIEEKSDWADALDFFARNSGMVYTTN